LEKYRHAEVAGESLIDPYIEAEIHITADSESNTITIQDFGIGMTDAELVDNLGTIARSGTREFVGKNENSQSLIGQFGVGFYSSFMVADTVEVYSRSAKEGSKGYLWRSDGGGTYDLAEAEGVSRGTKIILNMREDCKEFSSEKVLKDVLTKHSNFVNFKILLNGQRMNTVQAIWTLPKNEVTEEQHNEFYKFISHSYDKPKMKLHFQTDSPLNLSSIFYVPSEHTEKYGVGRMDPGVSLYCRKVLIQSNMKKFLPDYLRFIRGVVDCDDITLNISREHLQDSQLVNRLAAVLTRRLIKFFGEEAKRNPGDYEDFFNEYGQFIKEGIVTDQNDRENLAKLLRMESSQFEENKLVSLEDYITRMGEEQKEIYYVVSTKRSLAEGSPYMEHFKKKGIEVLFLYQAVDDWVMNAIGSFKGKTLKPIESAEVEKEEDNTTEEERAEIKSFNDWIRDELVEKVSSVKDTDRLTDSPAVIIDHETVAYRRMMMQVDPKRMPKMPKQALEINVKHPVMVNLRKIRASNPALATQAIEQVYDNAMVSAGLLTDNRPMLDRINSLLARTLEHELHANPPKE
jgi:TNF receptor-associated protein 1